MDSRELKEVVLRAQKGDSTAIEKLYTEFYESVFYFAKKTLRDDELACDITQETFMEVIRTIDKLEAPEAFASWIRQITYHQCTRHFKKKKDVLVDEDEDGNSVFDNLEDEDTPVPEEVCENEEFRSTILSIVDTLSEEQRSAVLLYYYDELPISKIAEMQGVSEGTVKSRLNYARKAIRSGVEQYEKKTGTKLHAIPFLPLIRIFFGAPEAMAASQSAAIGGAVSAAASAAATTAAIAGASGSAATAAAVGITAKLAAIPFGAKIAAAVLALSVTVTAGAVIVSNTETPSDIDNSDITVESTVEPETDVLATEPPIEEATVEAEPEETRDTHPDSDSDGICDNCNEYMCALYLAPHTTDYADRIYDEICDLCGRSAGGAMGGWLDERPHDDANGDGICDCCGERSCDLPMIAAKGGVDADGDNICDLCDRYMCDAHSKKVYHTDFDADGRCDSCPHAICAHGYIDHTDENGDRTCDICYSIVSTPIFDEEETALAETEIIVEETIEEAETEPAVDEIATETAETEEAIPDDMAQMIPTCLTTHIAPTLTIEGDILTIKNNSWEFDESNPTRVSYNVYVNGNLIFIPNEQIGMLCDSVTIGDTFSFSLLDYYATTKEGLNTITVEPYCILNVANGYVYCIHIDKYGCDGISSTIEYNRNDGAVETVEDIEA